MKHKKTWLTVLVIAIGGVALGACSQNTPPTAIQKDQQTSAQILQQLTTAQPPPQFSYSQIRQTLIDIETAQAKTTQTTTFFYNQGVSSPIMSCPSIGFPVASTSEITNPEQTVNSGYPTGGQTLTLPQIDPNGIYSGQSTGTYVLCVGANGQAYGVYWEGFVYAITGPAVSNSGGQVTPTGPSSFKFTTDGVTATTKK